MGGYLLVSPDNTSYDQVGNCAMRTIRSVYQHLPRRALSDQGDIKGTTRSVSDLVEGHFGTENIHPPIDRLSLSIIVFTLISWDRCWLCTSWILLYTIWQFGEALAFCGGRTSIHRTCVFVQERSTTVKSRKNRQRILGLVTLRWKLKSGKKKEIRPLENAEEIWSRPNELCLVSILIRRAVRIREAVVTPLHHFLKSSLPLITPFLIFSYRYRLLEKAVVYAFISRFSKNGTE